MARRVALVVCMDRRGPRHVGRYSFGGVGARCTLGGVMQAAPSKRRWHMRPLGRGSSRWVSGGEQLTLRV
eukprot:2655335-Prymnesium_polylepis.1